MENRPFRQPCSDEVLDVDDDSLMSKPMQNAAVAGTDGRVCMSTSQQHKEEEEEEEEESTTAENKTAPTTPESHLNGSRGAASERRKAARAPSWRQRDDWTSVGGSAGNNRLCR